MNKHTQGTLAERNGRIYCADRENLTIANIARSSDGDYSPANASRLVACWNVCIGISTENLEGNIPILELANRYNDSIKQRNELLEACKNLLTLTQLMANDEYEDIALVEFEIFSEITKSTRRLALADELAKARAAIAKAEGVRNA